MRRLANDDPATPVTPPHRRLTWRDGVHGRSRRVPRVLVGHVVGAGRGAHVHHLASRMATGGVVREAPPRLPYAPLPHVGGARAMAGGHRDLRGERRREVDRVEVWVALVSKSKLMSALD